MSTTAHIPAVRYGLRLLTIALISLALFACHGAEPVHNTRFLAFGTLMELSMIGVPRTRADQISAALENDFAVMHKAWHAWDPGPVPRTNQLLAAGEWFAAPTSLLPLLRESQRLSALSEGLFNPAVGHLIKLWGFQADNPECHKPPDADEIARLVAANPQLSDIDIDGFRLRSRNPMVKLDFGAIGKGYGIDIAIARLRELGIDNAIVNAGGDLRAIGSRDGHPWRIAIRGPTGSGMAAIVHVDGDESVFTSGDYERNFTWQGQIYHHIIDPRTGWPATGTASVTVIHSDATTADAAATALFVAGPKDWYRIAKKMGIHYVMLIDNEGTLHMNPEMQARIQLQDSMRKIVISAPLTD